TVKLTKLAGLREPEQPLVAELDVELPSTGAVTGSRALIPMAVFSAAAKSPLASEKRKSEIYFRHQYRVDDDVTLDVPAAYTVEAMPAGHNNDLGGIAFTSTVERTTSGVHLTRSLAVKTIAVDVEKYKVLRDFFKGVATADQDQVVLKKAAK